jgi:hypothetical protein
MKRMVVVTALVMLAGCASDGSICPLGRPCPGWSAEEHQRAQQAIGQFGRDFNAQQQEAIRTQQQRQHELRMQRAQQAHELTLAREREAAASERAQKEKEFICETRTELGITKTVCKGKE